MAQETLKLVITADTQEALANLKTFIGASKGLKEEMQNFGKVGNQATTALSNLSRVAQDAPYGFIGIANNLNPLLESFQRLKVEAGSGSAALKAMGSSLMGPAGIGLALGAVSSIIVAFGPKIAEFISGTKKATEVEDKFAKSLREATAQASETGIRLQSYLTISENINVSESKRAEALKAVKSELSKVNSSYASTITNVDEARKAVELYTQSLIAQALSARYIDQIADKTQSLADVNKKILESGREYFKQIDEQNKLISKGQFSAAVDQAVAAKASKKANISARKDAINLKGEIIGLKNEVNNLYINASKNPFFSFTKGATELANQTGAAASNIKKIQSAGVAANAITGYQQTIPTFNKPQTPTIGEAGVGFQGAPSQAIVDEKDYQDALAQFELLNATMQLTAELTDVISSGFNNVFEAFVNGQDIGAALEQTFKQIVVQLVEMIAKALIFKTILSALGVGVGLPTDLLNAASFGQGGGLMGEFLLKGSDLVLATTRANNNLRFRR